MIDPFELRLRNWIFRNGKPAQVWTNGQDDLQLIDETGIGIYRNNGDCQPIPLTRDLLEKCGAEEMRDDGREPDGWRLYYSASYNDSGKDYFCVWNELPDSLLCDNYSAAPLKYLHQLQNLYYCLTGQELEVKP